MKKTLLFLFTLVFVSSMFSKPVSKDQALKVAESFFKNKTNGKSVSLKSVYTKSYNNLTTMYIVNFADGGFVIVSADDRVKPILAYSENSIAPEKKSSPEFEWWITSYSKQIDFAVKNDLKNEKILDDWSNILNSTFVKGEKAVIPLLTTTWGQGSGYDDYCPPGTPTGCVATAMAQIMNFWEFPASGVNWHTYSQDPYGEQTAYFQNETYDWANMPDFSGSDAVAILMYHCGVAVDMNYDPAGSGAFSRDVPMVMANYFKYDQGIDFVEKSDYSNTDWINLIKTEIDAGRPVYYSGRSTDSGGHAFVFDGYDDFDFFHINWGWGGTYNGYFEIGDVAPGSYDFNDENAVVIGIQPSVAGNEMFYAVRKYSDFPNDSEYPGYIDGVNDKIAWAIGRDGSGDGLSLKDFTRTTDGGATWTGGSVSSTATAFSMISGVNKDTAYIAAYASSTANQILRTYDGGLNWSTVLNGAGSSSFFNIVHFFNEQDGFVQGDPEGGDFEIYTTNNHGDSWTRVSNANIPDPVASEWGIVGHYTSVGETVWFTTNKGRIYKSEDKGNTWMVYDLYTGTDGSQIEIAFDDTGLNGIANVSVDDANNSIEYYSSTDGGLTWTQIFPSGNFYDGGISSVPGEVNTFISVGSDYSTPKMGISKSIDGGATWADFPEYYQNYQMISVDMTSANKGYIGTFKGDNTGGMYVFGEPSAELIAAFISTDNANHDSLFCINTDVVFTNNSEGFINSLDWDFGSDATPANASGVGPHTVQYSVGGEKNVSLTVTDSESTDVYSKTILIAENIPDDILEITGNSEVMSWANETYTVASQDNTGFEWVLPYDYWTGESTTNSIDVHFTNITASGTIECKAVNGCGESNIASLDINITLSNVNDIDSKLNMFPNPAQNQITLTNMRNNSIIVIFDLTGRKVYEEKISSETSVINLSNFSEGIYTIKVFNNENISTGKFTIIK